MNKKSNNQNESNIKQFKDAFPLVFPMKAVPDIKKNHLTLLYENL